MFFEIKLSSINVLKICLKENKKIHKLIVLHQCEQMVLMRKLQTRIIYYICLYICMIHRQ